MNPSLATMICICGIAGLFYLDRDKSIRTSRALWLPVTWIAISASRPVSAWFGARPTGPHAELDGSPVDAAIFGALLVAAIAVLIPRARSTRILLAANWPILAYFLYCLLSVAWSYHPDVAVKRWIKAIGDIAMVFVVVTDAQPVAAFRRLISRVGFLLLPTSVLFIRYYGDLGKAYSPDGIQVNTGVTTNKNILGVIVLVISLGTLWRVLTLLRDRAQLNRRRHVTVQITLLLFGISLLKLANSATSIACFGLGVGIIFATGMRAVRRRPARVHVLCLTIILTGAITMLVGGGGAVVHALGRQSNLSGRTDIWAAVIPAVPNAILGAGFESFWISPSVLQFQRALVRGGWWHPEVLNEAHNGYIEVYLNLGWAGVVLISLVLISGYRRAVEAFRLNPSIGGLMLAYVVAAAVYSVTEAGFRMMDPIWIFLLLAIVSSSAVAAGVFGTETSRRLASRSRARERPFATGEFRPARGIVFTARPGKECNSIQGSIL
jgi:exopolysaccharide production protein ExoQ